MTIQVLYRHCTVKQLSSQFLVLKVATLMQPSTFPIRGFDGELLGYRNVNPFKSFICFLFLGRKLHNIATINPYIEFSWMKSLERMSHHIATLNLMDVVLEVYLLLPRQILVRGFLCLFASARLAEPFLIFV